MYLVPAEQRQVLPAKQLPKRPSKKPISPKKPKRPKPRSRLHPYDKWVKVRGKIREDELERKARVKAVADFLKSVLPRSSPPPPSPPPVVHQRQTTPTQTEVRVATPPTVPVGEIYETPKRRPDDDEDDDEGVDDDEDVADAQEYGPVADSYLNPYLHKRSFLDTQYVIRKEGVVFIIGDSQLSVDRDSDITIKGKHFRGTQGLWELLTCRMIQRDKLTTDDLRA